MAINAPTYDPTKTAAALAEKYVSARQQILDTQTKQANATEAALTELGTAMRSFQNSLAALTGLTKTMFAQSATFGDTAIGSATAKSTAAAGSYSFFVQQLAKASQVSYSGLADDTPQTGPLGVQLNGTTAITIDLTDPALNTDGVAGLSPRELAAAINGDAENASLVTASVVNTGTSFELVLTAKSTGAAGVISLDTSTMDPASSLAAANTPVADPLDPYAASGRSVLVKAQDAIVRVGSETGTAITKSSNTFADVIDGVSMTFTKAHASGDAPVTLTVGADTSGTTANVQAFVDAFNKLKATLNKLTDPGDPSKGVAAGTFARDGGVRALNARLTDLLRPAGGDSLAAYGILATRQGTLELRADRLMRQLAANPGGLDTLIGKATASTPTGIAGALDTYLKSWSNTVDGQITLRNEATSDLRNTLVDRQATLDKEFDAAYQRYLIQFTQLQSLQGIMTNNSSLFDALFSNDD